MSRINSRAVRCHSFLSCSVGERRSKGACHPHAIVTSVWTPRKIVICSSFLSCPGHTGLEVIAVSHSAKESLKCFCFIWDLIRRGDILIAKQLSKALTVIIQQIYFPREISHLRWEFTLFFSNSKSLI